MKNQTSDNLAATSYINHWAVIGGAVVALAISLILAPFGHALGLSSLPTLKPENAKWVVFTVGLWMLWVQLISSIFGGYFAGRSATHYGLTQHENEFRDGMHGLLAWAVATILAVIGAGLASLLAGYSADHNDITRAVNANPALTRKAGIIFSFSALTSSIVSALAAWWLAVIGGDHRDNSVDFSHHISFRRKPAKKGR